MHELEFSKPRVREQLQIDESDIELVPAVPKRTRLWMSVVIIVIEFAANEPVERKYKADVSAVVFRRVVLVTDLVGDRIDASDRIERRDEKRQHRKRESLEWAEKDEEGRGGKNGTEKRVYADESLKPVFRNSTMEFDDFRIVTRDRVVRDAEEKYPGESLLARTVRIEFRVRMSVVVDVNGNPVPFGHAGG